jgi:hypothetical protein
MPSTILLEGAETFWAPNKNSRLMVNIIKWWSWDTPGVHGIMGGYTPLLDKP